MGDDDTNFSNIPPVRNSTPLPREALTLETASYKLADSGVQGVFIGDGDHRNDNISNAMDEVVKNGNYDLLFVEGASDMPKADIDRIQADVESQGISARAVPVDWEMAEKDKVIDVAKYEMGKAEAANILLNNGAERKDLESLKDDNHTENAEELINSRLDSKMDDTVAKKISDEVASFHDEHGRMPNFAVQYGNGHIGTRTGVDELVQHRLQEDHGLSVNVASIGIETGKAQTEMDFVGRNPDYSGNDYVMTVPDDGTHEITHLGDDTPQSQSLIGPSLVAKHSNEDTPLNAVSDAMTYMNQDAEAAATRAGIDGFSKRGEFHFYSHEDGIVPKAGEEISDQNIAEINQRGSEMAALAAEGEFDNEVLSEKATKALQDLDGTLQKIYDEHGVLSREEQEIEKKEQEQQEKEQNTEEIKTAQDAPLATTQEAQQTPAQAAIQAPQTQPTPEVAQLAQSAFPQGNLAQTDSSFKSPSIGAPEGTPAQEVSQTPTGQQAQEAQRVEAEKAKDTELADNSQPQQNATEVDDRELGQLSEPQIADVSTPQEPSRMA